MLSSFLSLFLLFAPLLSGVIPQQIDSIDSAHFSSLPYIEQMKAIISKAQRDPANAWIFLRSVPFAPDAYDAAHGLGHIVGNALYKRYGIAGVQYCTPELLYACYHGIIEPYFARSGENGIQSIEGLCAQYFNNDTADGRIKFENCIHGAGHGLYSYYAFDQNRAERGCESVSASMRHYCYEGIFMVQASFSPLAQAAQQADPWSVCAAALPEAKESCARFIPYMYISLANTAEGREFFTETFLAGVMRTCAAGGALLGRYCMQSVAHSLAARFAQEPREIAKRCGLASDVRAGEDCIKNAATEISFKGWAGTEKTSATLCGMMSDTVACAHAVTTAHTARTTVLSPEELPTFSPRPYE